MNKLDPEEASPEKAAAGWRAGVASFCYLLATGGLGLGIQEVR